MKKTNCVAFSDEHVSGGASATMLQNVLKRDHGYEWLDSEPLTIAAKEHCPPYGSDGDYWSKPNRETIFSGVYAIMREANPRTYPKIFSSPLNSERSEESGLHLRQTRPPCA